MKQLHSQMHRSLSGGCGVGSSGSSRLSKIQSRYSVMRVKTAKIDNKGINLILK